VTARSFGGIELSRATPAPVPGPLDERLYDLVEARFRNVAESEPTWATQLGIHAWDDRLPDPSRERLLGDVERDKAHLAVIEALDDAGLSPEARFERDLELHHVRLRVFRAETVRNWERRSNGASALGDALFPLFTRDFAPFAERLSAIAARLEAAPAFLRGYRSRAVVPQVREWLEVELRSSGNVPSFLDDIVGAADQAGATVPEVERKRLERAVDRARIAIEDQAEWLREILPGATGAWPLGRDRYGELVDMPVVIVAGGEDKVVDVGRHAVRLRERLPHADLRLVPGAGHMVHHAVPGQVAEVIEAVSAWSAGPSRPAARLAAAAE